MSEEPAEASRLRGSGPQEGAGEGARFMQADGQGQHWCPPAPVSEERAEMDKGCLPVRLSLQGDLQSRPSSTGPRASEHACPGGKQALFTGGLRRCARPHGRLAVTALRPSATSALLVCRPDVTGAHAPGAGPRGAPARRLTPQSSGNPSPWRASCSGVTPLSTRVLTFLPGAVCTFPHILGCGESVLLVFRSFSEMNVLSTL